MKKWCSFILAIMMLLTTGIITLPATAETNTVYLSATGLDSNTGSREQPVATVLKAAQLLGTSGGTICLISDLTVEGENRDLAWNRGSIGPLTFTSEGDVAMTFTGAGIVFGSDTTFHNIHLHFTRPNTDGAPFFVADGNKLTIGENVTVTTNENTYLPDIYGGGLYSYDWIPENADANIEIQSGSWGAVYGGGATGGVMCEWNYAHRDSVNNVNITVSGGFVYTLYGGSHGGWWASCEPCYVNGNVNLTITGGTINTVVANGQSPLAHIKGNVTIHISGGEIGAITVYDHNPETPETDSDVAGDIRLYCPIEYRSKASNIPIPGVTFVGIQLTAPVDGKQSIRFVATVDDLKYDKVGYEIVATYMKDGTTAAKSCKISSTSVYRVLLGSKNGEIVEYTAESLGGAYLYALTLDHVPTDCGDIVFTVKPFSLLDETVSYGVAYQVTISNGVYAGYSICPEA